MNALEVGRPWVCKTEDHKNFEVPCQNNGTPGKVGGKVPSGLSQKTGLFPIEFSSSNKHTHKK